MSIRGKLLSLNRSESRATGVTGDRVQAASDLCVLLVRVVVAIELLNMEEEVGTCVTSIGKWVDTR